MGSAFFMLHTIFFLLAAWLKTKNKLIVFAGDTERVWNANTFEGKSESQKILKNLS
jgi:hypothetical protein